MCIKYLHQCFNCIVLFLQKQAAIYGSSQTVPDRSLVGSLTGKFIDLLYETNFDDVALNGKN